MRVSSVFGMKPGNDPFTFPPMPTGSGGSHFTTPSKSVTSAPSSVGALGRKNRERKADPLRHLPSKSHGLDPEPGAKALRSGRVPLSGLETAGAQELELGPFRKKRVDLAVDELIARRRARPFWRQPTSRERESSRWHRRSGSAQRHSRSGCWRDFASYRRSLKTSHIDIHLDGSFFPRHRSLATGSRILE